MNIQPFNGMVKRAIRRFDPNEANQRLEAMASSTLFNVANQDFTGWACQPEAKE
jgi:hypothetical protein